MTRCVYISISIGYLYFVFLVLSRVGKAGYDGRDSTRRCRLAGADHYEEFHQMIVYFAAAALQDKNVFAANRFADFDARIEDGFARANDCRSFFLTTSRDLRTFLG